MFLVWCPPELLSSWQRPGPRLLPCWASAFLRRLHFTPRQKTEKENGAWPAGGFMGWALEQCTSLLLTSLLPGIQSHVPSKSREEWTYSSPLCPGARECGWIRGSLYQTMAVSLQDPREIIAVPSVWNGELGTHILAEEVDDTGNHRWIAWLLMH